MDIYKESNLKINVFFPFKSLSWTFWLKVVLLLICTFSFQVLFAQYLKTEGTKIVNSDGEEIILRGVGLGGWMLQEGYMLRTSGPQHEIEEKIKDLVGEQKMETFYEAWLSNHFTKADVDSMAAWGYNSIRLPMHYKLFTPPIEEEPVSGQITWRSKGFEMVDDLLSWVKANDMYLILDMHAAPGGQGENADISDYDPSKPSLWESKANRDKLVALWRRLADRYKDEPNIGAYDLINEPNWGFENHEADPNGCAESKNTLLWSLQKEITNAIREVDNNHMIVIEGNCWGNNYNGLPSLWDDNIVISYHKYWNSNDQGSIQGMINMRNQRNVPIWLGESGENSNTWFTDAINLLEQNKIGWAWWPWKKLGLNNPLEIKVNSGYQEILDYWNGNAEKPTADQAFDALMQLAEDLKIENNIHHPDVVDAMIRQPHTVETIPFQSHRIKADTDNIIFFVNYDLGRNQFAYYDTDATNETGKAGGLTWNKGYQYRNDGVDIENCEDDTTNGYNVCWTEDEEWMLYTVVVDSTGGYDLTIRYASLNRDGAISILVDNKEQVNRFVLPATGGYAGWQSLTIPDIILSSGQQEIKVLIDRGGVNLNYMKLELKKKVNEIPVKAVSAQTNEEGTFIYLNFNKELLEESVSAEGFALQIDGKAVGVSSAEWNHELTSSIKIHFEYEVVDQSMIQLSYSGGGITASDGSVLEDFENLAVQNNLPVHITIPAHFEAEDYEHNFGLEKESTTDIGGGYNMGYTNTGDYLDYRILVEDSGQYKLEVRVACNASAGILEIQQRNEKGDVLQKEQINIPVTGGWQNWQTVSTTMKLNPGRNILRLLIVRPEFNINWFSFDDIGNINHLPSFEGTFQLYPNPSQSSVKSVLPDEWMGKEVTYTLWNSQGSKLLENSFRLNTKEVSIDVSALKQGAYLMVWYAEEKRYSKRLIIGNP